MRTLIILILLAALAAAGFMTRPDEAAQKAHVDGIFEAQRKAQAEKLDIGKLISGGLVDVIRVGKYEDKFVATKYTVTVENRELISCWGAFSNFFCSELHSVKDAPKVDAGKAAPAPSN